MARRAAAANARRGSLGAARFEQRDGGLSATLREDYVLSSSKVGGWVVGVVSGQGDVGARRSGRVKARCRMRRRGDGGARTAPSGARVQRR